MALIKTILHNTKRLVGLAPKANVTAANENGTSWDCRSYEQFNSGMVQIDVGAATGAPSSFSIVYTLQHSDDDSTYVTAPKSDTSAQGDATLTATAAGVYDISFEPGRLKRYRRINRVVTITGGTSPTVPNGASFILGDASKVPQS